MNDAFICDAIRTPVGRFGGSLASVRADDLGAVPIKALMARNPDVDWEQLDDLIYGCANQAGEDNRNVARMSSLLAGLPTEVPGVTVNRLCGSGMDAIGQAARAIKTGEAALAMAGGVESMSRAPFVMAKADSAWSRKVEMFDTTMGWRFINPLMRSQYGVDSMPETAENVAEAYAISREDQDLFALRSQQRTAAAQARGFFAAEITPVTITRRKQDPLHFDRDEHPRASTTIEGLAKLGTPFRSPGTVTAGNASGINDGACALLLASEQAAAAHSLTPRARVIAMTATGTDPRIMGIGPVPATRKLLMMTGFELGQLDVIELNEAFAAQSLACLRELGLPDDAPLVNANGGAIAIGHPLGMSGARLVTTAINQLHATGGRYALCTMCIGVGQGFAMIIERVLENSNSDRSQSITDRLRNNCYPSSLAGLGFWLC
jgi:acetyl-CoA acyltransferase